MSKIFVYDTTLRDGMQGVDAHFTIEDKARIAALLDTVGVSFIECGAPGFNIKDKLFFEYLKEHPLKQAKAVAFGSTCRAGETPETDGAIQALKECATYYVCIYGKSSEYQSKTVLGVSKEENLKLISDSVAYLKAQGKHVFYDAEHFFGGYKEDRNYAVETLKAAKAAGAEYICLCDTKGAAMPEDIRKVFTDEDVASLAPLGIHAHNDIDFATYNTIEAVKSGASFIESTLMGIGERCGNADMFSVLPTLQLKLGYDCITDENMKNLTGFYYKAADLLNMKAFAREPYVGRDAFSHKGGTHIDGVIKDSNTYEHINPEDVGNRRRTVLSELSGKAAVLSKIKKLMPEKEISSVDAEIVLAVLKDMELEGFQYESADASFEILVRKTLGMDKSFFKLDNYRVVSVNGSSSAIVDVFVGDEEEVTASNGNGPVDALDGALRKALARFYPQLSNMRLVDYKVRVLDTKRATASKVRVLIESTDGNRNWVTVGLSEDIIEASKIALLDSHEYLLYSET